jgi:hypothetical protein
MLNTLAAATYTLVKPSTSWINWTDLLHILLASLAAGAGIAVAFGLFLLGMEYFQEGKSEGIKIGGWLLGAAGLLFCVGAIGVGVYVMTNPPSSTPATVVKNPPSTSSSSSTEPHVHTTDHKLPG